MKTWGPDATTIDRDAGQGPPACCDVRHVAADALVWWGNLSAGTLAALRIRFPQWQSIADVNLYLCGSCREMALRHKVTTREDVARALGLTVKQIAAAWVHDEEFLRRGPSSAPVEVTAQPWWAGYQIAAAGPPASFRSAVQQMLRNWSIP